MQAQIESNRLVVLVNGTELTGSLISSNSTSSCDSNSVDVNRTSDTSLQLTFISGVAVDVNLRVGLLSFVVRLPDQFMGQARGLLGNFDGNATNDFVYRNGTMIPNSSSDREIHGFGQSCKNHNQVSCLNAIDVCTFLFHSGQIDDSESLFTYPDGLTAANFSFPGYMPAFLDELDNNTLSSARELCGSDSQCIYDFSQTGNMELAMATLETNRENRMEQTIASTFIKFCDSIMLIVLVYI